MKNVKVNSDVELKDRLVAINRVTKVTKGGRTFTFAAIVVVGDGNGIIGWGLGKAGEVTAAIAKGVEAAKKNLVKVGSPLRWCSGVPEARCCRYRSCGWWCYACRAGERRCQGRACQVEGFFQPPQLSEGHHHGSEPDA